jgi:hypothetical protein
VEELSILFQKCGLGFLVRKVDDHVPRQKPCFSTLAK